MLAELLEQEYLRWLQRKYLGLPLQRNSTTGVDGIGQIIHQPFPTTNDRFGGSFVSG